MSWSIWCDRMIELRMMMPSSAMNPKDGDEAEGCSADKQGRRSTDDSERTGGEHQHRLAEMLKLHHQEDDDHTSMSALGAIEAWLSALSSAPP